jgi:predicted dehydrogenase
MGRRHAQIFHDLDGTPVKVVCDVVPETAQAVAETVNARATTSVEDAIADPSVAIVCICTSDAEHKEPALLAAKHSKPFFLEKPVATSLEDCDAIIAAVNEAGIPAMAGHVLRFEPRYWSIKRLIEQGQIGEVQTIASHRIQGIAAQDRLKGRCSLPLFLGVHEFDIQRWLVGSEIAAVTAKSKWGLLSGQGYPVEDATFTLIEFVNGALGVVELGWILPRGHYSGDSRVDVVGSEGAVTLSGMEGGLIWATTDRTSAVDTVMTPNYYDHRSGAFAFELQHFVDAVRRGTPPLCSLEDGREAVRVALAAEESSRTGQTVRLRDGQA